MAHELGLNWHRDDIAVIHFKDQARQNQWCWAAIDELAALLTQCRESGARIVVLASDLKGHWYEHAWLRDLHNMCSGEETTAAGTGWFTALDELSRQPLISIAAISGDCSGGGAELGWACDLRIAEKQARFCQPEINIGLTTGVGGSSRLSRLAGRSVASEMVLTGEPVGAERLHQLGVINTLVDEGRAVQEALSLAESLAAKPPQALLALKRIIAQGENMPLDSALEFEQSVFQETVVGEAALAKMSEVQKQFDKGMSMADVYRYDKK